MAINDGDQDEAERLSMVALEELPLANYYSRIVLVAIVNRHLRAQRVEVAMHRCVHFHTHLLLGARQQGIDFAVARCV